MSVDFDFDVKIGVDLGGTKIEAAALDASGEMLIRRRVATPQGDYSATLTAIRSLVQQMERELAVQMPAVGIAAPGSPSRRTGLMRNCNSTCLNDRPLVADLESLLNKEVRIANDADCFTLSEATDGAAAGGKLVFGVILGTGVGGGICVNGKLLAGVNGIAGEWGHNPMPLMQGRGVIESIDSRLCYCGRYDCIETWLSGPALESEYHSRNGEHLSAVELARRAQAGEELAVELLDAYQQRLARALASVINLLDPEVIVLGGGLSNIESLYTEVPKHWEAHVFSDSCETKLLSARYGDSSGVRGAAWLVEG